MRRKVIVFTRPIDKWDIFRYIASKDGNVTIEELNKKFASVYDEEIGEAVIEYLAMRREW